MDIRDRIRELIDADEDATIRSVSLKAGLSDSMLGKFLDRKTKSITVDNLERIAAALGTTVRYLLYGEEGDNVVSIYSRIPKDMQAQALKVLESFAGGRT